MVLSDACVFLMLLVLCTHLPSVIVKSSCNLSEDFLDLKQIKLIIDSVYWGVLGCIIC